MDTTTRLIIKSATWQIAGLLTMTIIGFLFTGSFAASSGIAIVGSIAGFISYFLHEIVWSKVKWGRSVNVTSTQLVTAAQTPAEKFADRVAAIS